MNLCTQYGYDRLGYQTMITDAEDVVQRTVYNAFGLPVQIVANYGGVSATTSLDYDNALNLIRVVDANGNTTDYTYTPRNAREEEQYADGTRVSYQYDARGNVSVTTLQDDETITNLYDALGRRESASFSSGGSQSFAYDDSGRMTMAQQILDGHTTILTYAYNALGDVVSTTQKLDTGQEWRVDYSYDYENGVYTVTYPSGAERVRTLDPIGRLDKVEQGNGALVADYRYYDAFHYNTISYGNERNTTVYFDAVRRITEVASALADYLYGYDDVGNRTYMQRWHKSGHPADVYEYDALYQLTQAWYGADATEPGSITSYDLFQQYDLDQMGNRLEVQNDGVPQTYGPNDGEKLTDPMNRYGTVDTTGLSYDLRGNTLDDGVNDYSYDVLNRQKGADGPGGTATYVYDARGRRVAKVVDGVWTHYIYDVEYRVLEERDEFGVLLALYTYGVGMDEPLTMDRGGITYYYHRDALGSITEVTNGSAVLVERYEYDVYGAVTIYDASFNLRATSAIENPYLFTGRRYDPETGNYYYRARMYSPWLGRFLSMDPLGFEAGDYNLYRYVFNNPVNLTDPTGEYSPLDLLFVGWDVIQLGQDMILLLFVDRCEAQKVLENIIVDGFVLGMDLILPGLLPPGQGGTLVAALAGGGRNAALRAAGRTWVQGRMSQVVLKELQYLLRNKVYFKSGTGRSGGHSSGGGDEGGYYKPGKKYTREQLEDMGAELLEKSEPAVKSQPFKEFIRAKRRRFVKPEWRYVMEKWQLPDGRVIKNDYWWNRKTGETWYHD